MIDAKGKDLIVGVVGCGAMGQGIIQVALQGGLSVVAYDAKEGGAAAGTAKVVERIDRLVEKERISTTDADGMKGALTVASTIDDLAPCGVVVEAIFEDIDVKRELFTALEAVVAEDAILASNTSSLPIGSIARVCRHPGRVAGLHFFNPVPVMKLGEVVRTIATSEETYDRAFEFAKALGKVPIAAKDNSGFVVNLLLVPYMLDAIRQLERGVASVQDIDTGMSLGCGYPMGPFMLCDFVGIDTLYKISEIMFDEYREERYAPPPLLKRIVAMNRYGRKTGKGFYDWSGETPVPLPL